MKNTKIPKEALEMNKMNQKYLKHLKYLLAILLIPCVSANVVIQQVLYDPLNDENGGEAVELRNTGSEPIDISGWFLATSSSPHDATFPDGSIMMPGRVFLVADKSWSDKRDNLDWRNADYEESLTLSNTDGGVALVNGNDTIDAVGWGDSESISPDLFQTESAANTKPGNSLLRVSDTQDNSIDFTETGADFFEGIPVPLTADVTLNLPVLEVSQSLKLNPEGTLSIKNNGERAVQLKIHFSDLHYKNYIISSDSLAIEGPAEITVQPLSSYNIKVKLNTPKNSQPGKYISTLRVQVLDENFGT